VPETNQPAPPTQRGSTSAGTAGRIVGLVLAGVAGTLGLVLLLVGLALVALHAFGRDDGEYYTSQTELLETDGYAIVGDQPDLRADPLPWSPEELLGTIRITVEAADGQPVLLGIGTQNEVDAYLRDVDHATIADFGDPVTYDEQPGGAPRRPPGAEELWVTSVEGEGEQSLTWDSEGGVWSAVVMNADAARGVAVDAHAGVEFEYLHWFGLVLAALGALLLALAAIAARALVRRPGREPAPQG
jgi:hypothetical protein